MEDGDGVVYFDLIDGGSIGLNRLVIVLVRVLLRVLDVDTV